MTLCRNSATMEFNYCLSSSSLNPSGNTVKDLSIIMDQKLTYHAHIEASCCKALNTLGLHKRICSEFKMVVPLKTLYCVLVRPTCQTMKQWPTLGNLDLFFFKCICNLWLDPRFHVYPKSFLNFCIFIYNFISTKKLRLLIFFLNVSFS